MPDLPTSNVGMSSAPAANTAPLPPIGNGTHIAQEKRYEIIEPLGEGGMGHVFKAYEPVIDRHVALKILKPDTPELERERFLREATLAANFAHPNLVRVLDRGVWQPHGLSWLAMEYLRGYDMATFKAQGKTVTLPLFLEVVRQTCDALDYIHPRGIAHCDIKPANLFVTRDTYDRRLVLIKLIDFGIASDFHRPFSPRHKIVGDPRYMAPEQATIDTVLDTRTDIYSLGISLYELLVGEHPYHQWFNSVRELIRAHTSVPLPPPSKNLQGPFPAQVLRNLDGVFERACAKDPADRHNSAFELRTELLHALAPVARLPTLF